MKNRNHFKIIYKKFLQYISCPREVHNFALLYLKDPGRINRHGDNVLRGGL